MLQNLEPHSIWFIMRLVPIKKKLLPEKSILSQVLVEIF